MYSYEGRIRFSETDGDLKLKLNRLIDYFQDAALFEAADGKVNMEYLNERKLAWLLGAWQIEIVRLPQMGERVEITTIPYQFKGFLGNRNFYMKTQEGELLAYANSIWSLTDMERMVPSRPTEEILSGYEIGEKIDMEYKPRKIQLDGLAEEMEKIKVGIHQIDSNHHMNNAEYVTLAMSYLPKEAKIKEIRVEYKMSAYYQDEIFPVVYRQQDKMQIKLQNEEQRTYAVIEFSFA